MGLKGGGERELSKMRRGKLHLISGKQSKGAHFAVAATRPQISSKAGVNTDIISNIGS
jgi:hypothetical protein